MYVCMYGRPSHSIRTVCHTDLKLGKWVADDLRMSMHAFGTVWMPNVVW